MGCMCSKLPCHHVYPDKIYCAETKEMCKQHKGNPAHFICKICPLSYCVVCIQKEGLRKRTCFCGSALYYVSGVFNCYSCSESCIFPDSGKYCIVCDYGLCNKCINNGQPQPETCPHELQNNKWAECALCKKKKTMFMACDVCDFRVCNGCVKYEPGNTCTRGHEYTWIKYDRDIMCDCCGDRKIRRAYTCRTCCVHICTKKCRPFNPATLVCPNNNHVLESYTGALNLLNCDTCENKLKGSALYCDLCNFYMCSECVNKISASPQPKPLPKSSTPQSTGVPGGTNIVPMQQKSICRNCQKQTPIVTLLPCNHTGLCKECADQYLNKECPSCDHIVQAIV